MKQRLHKKYCLFCVFSKCFRHQILHEQLSIYKTLKVAFVQLEDVSDRGNGKSPPHVGVQKSDFSRKYVGNIGLM